MNSSVSPHLNPKYNWREIPSRDLPKRSSRERIADFLEVYGLFDESTAQEQASRCIQCPNPGCVTGCPLCNPIPEWMRLTAEGKFDDAAAYLGANSSVAEICARLCPRERLCEETCILNGASEPVAIAAIEQFLIERALGQGKVDTSTSPPCGLRVAIVGSGPGPLACADELARRGCSVTVHESCPTPGGLLTNGLPEFKLEKSVIQRRIELLRKRGVVFRTESELGRNLSLADLRRDFDVVYLGCDARQPRSLQAPGADLAGVVQAIPFILQKTTSLILELPPLDLENKRVVVVGGGDTAMDAARTAIRCHPREVLCVYRRGEPDMPCSPHDYHNAVEEGVRFQFHAAPLEVLNNGSGAVKGLRLAQTEATEPVEAGRRGFRVRSDSEFEIDADCVILALGFEPVPLPPSNDFEGISIDDHGAVVVDANQQTSVPGVYAGGDIVRGPCHPLYAVRDARRAATGIYSHFASRQPAA